MQGNIVRNQCLELDTKPVTRVFISSNCVSSVENSIVLLYRLKLLRTLSLAKFGSFSSNKIDNMT